MTVNSNKSTLHFLLLGQVQAVKGWQAYKHGPCYDSLLLLTAT